MNQRGQGLSTNAIILIILGVVVLAVLIIGFTVGWGTIAPWLSSNNVDSVVNQCATACSTQNTYGFCSETRTLKADDLPDGEMEKEGSCYFFANAEGYEPYDVDGCPALEGEVGCTPEDLTSVEAE